MRIVGSIGLVHWLDTPGKIELSHYVFTNLPCFSSEIVQYLDEFSVLGSDRRFFRKLLSRRIDRAMLDFIGAL